MAEPPAGVAGVMVARASGTAHPRVWGTELLWHAARLSAWTRQPDCVSGDVLRAHSLLFDTANDLAPLLNEVAEAICVLVIGTVSDG